MTEKLLPCPFCGGTPELSIGAAGDTLIKCENAIGRGTPSAVGHQVFVAARRKAEAIIRWNRRAPREETK